MTKDKVESLLQRITYKPSVKFKVDDFMIGYCKFTTILGDRSYPMIVAYHRLSDIKDVLNLVRYELQKAEMLEVDEILQLDGKVKFSKQHG